MTDKQSRSGLSLDQELEELQRRRPTPPPFLFKYVSPDRDDVLTNARIRFTPPLNTNDIFEVRQTFDLVMGPKMHQYFKELSKEVDLDEAFDEALADTPLAGLSADQAKEFISEFVGADSVTLLRGLLGEVIDQMPAYMNAPENIDRLLKRLASNLLLLSLSERFDSSPMWAHYAANSAGFVIAFNTRSEFFRRGHRSELQGLHKVEYFDGRVPEIIDSPYAALVSKQAAWAYEHEWRLYAKAGDVTQVLKGSEEDIHLISFPREAVERVILGVRASHELEHNLRRILDDYSGVSLMRLKADRSTAELIEEPA